MYRALRALDLHTRYTKRFIPKPLLTNSMRSIAGTMFEIWGVGVLVVEAKSLRDRVVKILHTTLAGY